MDCKTLSTISDNIRTFISSIRYGIPKILRYNTDCGNLRVMISSELITSTLLMYFSMILRSELDATLLVIIERPLSSA